MVMRARGVGNAAVAEAAGVHKGTVSQWLNDRFPEGPTDENLKPVADLLSVTVSWLRYGSDSTPTKQVAREVTIDAYAPTVRVSPVRVPGHAAGRLRKVNLFAREMARIGADDFEVDYVAERGRSYVESVLFGEGAPELSIAEYDEELDEYINKVLRAWVKKHMTNRGAKPLRLEK